MNAAPKHQLAFPASSTPDEETKDKRRKRSQDEDPLLSPLRKQPRAPSLQSPIKHAIGENAAAGQDDIKLLKYLDKVDIIPPGHDTREKSALPPSRDSSHRPSPRSRYNSAFVSRLQKVLEMNPEADLAPHISNYCTERLNGLRGTSGTTILSVPRVEREPDIVLPSIPKPCGTFNVMSALAPQVQKLIGLDPLVLWHRLKHGKVLHQLHSKWIVKICPSIVVKFAPSLEISEYQTMCHVWSHRENIPVPEPLGAVSIGSCNYIFMSYVEGETLESLWGSFSPKMKSSVRIQMEEILQCLRKMPLQSKYLGSGDPPLCKDQRRHIRTSTKSISNEIEFKEFLLSPPRELNPVYLDLITSTLSTSHQIVMTHGDLRLENILALYTSPNTIKITGLIDWESSGAYPEYWEYIKALAGVRWSLSDWFSYLPVNAIGTHKDAWRQECLIDQLIL